MRKSRKIGQLVLDRNFSGVLRHNGKPKDKGKEEQLSKSRVFRRLENREEVRLHTYQSSQADTRGIRSKEEYNAEEQDRASWVQSGSLAEQASHSKGRRCSGADN